MNGIVFWRFVKFDLYNIWKIQLRVSAEGKLVLSEIEKDIEEKYPSLSCIFIRKKERLLLVFPEKE